MSGILQFFGLCTSCQNAEECTFPRDPDRPVCQCEEFAGYESLPGRVSLEGSRPSRTGFVQEEKNTGSWIGLCKNCGNRETCSFPKPEGGVWHCDEYF
jgi:hypothetical protein